MRSAKDIMALVWHCTAGFGDVRSIEDFWRDKLGWKRSKGYVVIIEQDGTKWYLKSNTEKYGYTKDPTECDWLAVTNGVLGYNDLLMNMSYIGGVNKDNYKIAEDTRTEPQKASMFEVTHEAIMWLKRNGKDTTFNFDIWGHRDFSKDKNQNGVIEPWERIKECPSFEVMEEYGWITGTNKLPNL